MQIGVALWLAVAAGSARAATRTWNGNGGDAFWGTAANWNEGALGATNTPTFGAAGASGTTLTNDTAGTTVDGIAFNNGAGTYTIVGNGITLGGDISVGTGVVAESVHVDMVLSATRTVTLGSGSLTLGGVVSGTAGRGLITTGVGSLVLSGANTFDGPVTIGGTSGGPGTLSVASMNRVSAPVASSNLGRPTTVANGTITLGTLGGSAGKVLYTGAGETTDRTIKIYGASLFPGSMSILDQSGAGGTLELAGSVGLATGVVSAKQLQLQGSTAGIGKISGAISGNTLSLIKNGTGTWVLSGTNTLGGSTTVSNGVLLVNSPGSLPASSAVTVAGTGTLGGSGTIHGPVTVSAGGTIQPTMSGAPGALTLSSDTAPTFGAYATLKIRAAGGATDRVALSSATPVFGCSTLNLVLDTTALSNNVMGATIVQTAHASGIAGKFNTTNVVGSYRATLAYSPTNVTVDLIKAANLAIVSVNGGTNAVSGVGFSVVVQAQDGLSGATNVAADTAFALTLKSGTGALGGTTNGTIAAGTSQVTVSSVTYTKAESNVVITATRTSGDLLAAGDSAAFTVVAGDPAALSLTSGNGQVGDVLTALASPLVVTVTDAHTNPVAGTAVAYAITGTPPGATGQSLSVTNATTLANGQASSLLTIGSVTGAYTVAASAAGLSGSPVTFNATGASIPPTTLAITLVNGGSNPSAGTGFGVVVQAQDAGGVPRQVLSDTAVVLSRSAGSGTLGGTLTGTLTNGSNSVSISGVTYTKAESGVVLTATRTSGDALSAGTSAAFTVDAGAAAALALTSGNNQTGGAGTVLGPLVVTVTDAHTNAVPGVDVAYAIAATPPGATGQALSSTNDTTTGSGQASSTLTLGTATGTYAVVASAVGLSGSPVTFQAMAVPPWDGMTATYDADTGTPGAQDGTGTGWNTASSNFWNGVRNIAWPNGTTNVAILGAGTGAAGLVTVGTVNANGLVFNPPGSGAYALTNGTITLVGAAPTLTANSAAVIQSALAGTAGLTKAGGADLTLSGGNSVSGSARIGAGRLLLNNYGSWMPAAGITIDAGATLAFNNTGTYTPANAATIGGGGTLAKSGAGTFNAGSGAGMLTFAMTGGVVDVQAGTFAATASTAGAAPNWVNNRAALNIEAGARVTMSAQSVAGNNFTVDALTGTGQLIITGFGGAFTVGANDGSGTFAGVITNSSGQSLAFTKNGTGTQILSGTNYYSGATTINGGLLLVDGDHTACAGSLTVKTNATLGGRGTLGGAVVVQGGGTLQPTLTGEGGTLTLLSGTSPSIATNTTLRIRAPGSVPDLVNLANTGAVFRCAGLELVVDVTGLTGDVFGAPIVQVARASGGIVGTFRGVRVEPAGAALVHYNAQTITLDLPPHLTIVSVNGGTNPIAGVPFGILVGAADGGGHPAPVSQDTSFALSRKTGAGVLGGTLVGTIPAGSNAVTVSGLTYTKAESGVRLTASQTAGDFMLAGDSEAFTVDPGPASSLTLTTGDSQTNTVGTALASPLVVTVRDANGNAVPGYPVAFALDGAPAGAVGQALSATNVFTAANGEASAGLTLGDKPGSYRVAAAGAGLAGSPVSFSATGAGRLAILFVNGGSNPSAGVGFSVVVRAQNALNQPLAVTTNTAVALTLQSGSGTLGGTLTGTIAAGSSTVTINGVTYTRAESGVVLAVRGVGGDPMTAGTSGAFTVNPGPAVRLQVVSGNNQSRLAGQALLNPLVVAAMDAFTNAVPGMALGFAIAAAPPAAAGQTLSVTNAVTDVLGQAATTLTLGDLVGVYHVAATSGALTPATFTATARAPWDGTWGIYDANTNAYGPQDGAGAGWNTTNINFWADIDNTFWPNGYAEAIFGGGQGTAGTVNVGSVLAQDLRFDPTGAGEYTLAGGTLSLVGSPVGGPSIVTAVTNATITATMSGSLGMAKRGAGTVTFSGTGFNAFSGALDIEEGRVVLRDLDVLSVTNIHVRSNAVVELSTVTRDYKIIRKRVVLTGNGTYVKSGPRGFDYESRWFCGGADPFDWDCTHYAYFQYAMSGGLIDIQGGTFFHDYDSGEENGSPWIPEAPRAFGSNKASLNVAAGALVKLANWQFGYMWVDALTGLGTVQCQWQSAQTRLPAVLTVGVNNGSGTFNGLLDGTGGGVALTKVGSGTQTLAGVSQYLGPTVVADGTLLVRYALASPAVAVSSNATFGGSVTVSGTITNAGALAPGGVGGTGSLSVLNDVTMLPGSTLDIDIQGPSGGSAANGYDQVLIAPGRRFALGDGTAALNVRVPDGTGVQVGQVFMIVAGDFSGTQFQDLPEGRTVKAGDYAFLIHYDRAGEVITLTVTAAGGGGVLMIVR